MNYKTMLKFDISTPRPVFSCRVEINGETYMAECIADSYTAAQEYLGKIGKVTGKLTLK